MTAAGVPGALARQSAARAPRRTAATVTALALSLALVVLIAVVGASIKTSMRDSYREVVSADLVVESARGEMLGGLVPAAYRTTAALAEVDVVSQIRYGHWKDPHTGTVSALTAIDPATLPEVTNLDLVSGSLDRLEGNHLDSVSDGVGGLVLSERVASQRGLTVGDQLPMRFARVGTRPLVVVGVISDSAAQALGTDFLVSLATYDQLYTERMDASLLVKVSAGSSVGAAAHDLETALSRLPPVEVRDQAAAADARTRAVDQIVGMVTALLLFSVLIAMLGIINTLALSILERTRGNRSAPRGGDDSPATSIRHPSRSHPHLRCRPGRRPGAGRRVCGGGAQRRRPRAGGCGQCPSRSARHGDQHRHSRRPCRRHPARPPSCPDGGAGRHRGHLT